MSSDEKKKDGWGFTASTKVAPKNDTLQTSSTRGTNTNSIDDNHDNTTSTDDNNNGVTFHNNKNNNSKKFAVVYWRNGLSLPESGHLSLTEFLNEQIRYGNICKHPGDFFGIWASHRRRGHRIYIMLHPIMMSYHTFVVCSQYFIFIYYS